MFQFKKIQTPLLLNQMKNWITFSPNTFQLIIDNILKQAILFTNWKLNQGKLVYNHPFECKKILENISNI